MRLKLAGLPLGESAVPSPAVARWQYQLPCARAHVARSLSAIRWAAQQLSFKGGPLYG
jgi:hypothetical protein